MIREVEATVPGPRDETLLRNWLKKIIVAERMLKGCDYRTIGENSHARLIPSSVLNRGTRDSRHTRVRVRYGVAILLGRSRIVRTKVDSFDVLGVTTDSKDLGFAVRIVTLVK